LQAESKSVPLASININLPLNKLLFMIS
jgi:hypothetical protein